jgi:hypothetical protein
MPYIYPQPIRGLFGPFEHVPMVVKSDEAVLSSLARHVTISSGGEAVALVEASKLVGTTKCVLYLGDQVTNHFNNGDDGSGAVDPNIGLPFKYEKQIRQRPLWFCPGVDEPRIGWKTRLNDQIGTAVVEVYAAGLVGPISRKEIPVADLDKNPVKDEKDEKKWKVTGSKPFAEVLEFLPAHKDQFPDNLLTVAHSPYQVRLTITRKPGSTAELYPSISWTFFHVLADRTIDLAWGEEGELGNVPREDLDARFRLDMYQRERAILAALKDRPPTENQEIVLTAFNHNAFRTAGDNTPQALKYMWGDGPRIPVKAQAWVLKADGTRASAADSAKALGKVRFLWDWTEGRDNKPENWMVDHTPNNVPGEWGVLGHGKFQRWWFRKMVTTTVDPTGPQPFGSINCPRSYEGKRGDLTKPIFPRQNGAPPFRFHVDPIDPGAGRPWASTSKPGDAGDARAKTGAIFQPSRFPGDRYQIHVYLLGAGNGTDLPNLLVNDDGRPLSEEIDGLSDGEQPPRARSGTFQIFRKTNLTLIEVGCQAAQAAAAAKLAFEKLANTKLEVTVTPLPHDAVSRGNGNRYRTLVRDRLDQIVAREETDRPLRASGWIVKEAMAKDQPDDVGDMLFDFLSHREWLDRLVSKRFVSFVAFAHPPQQPLAPLRLSGGQLCGVLYKQPFVASTTEQKKRKKKVEKAEREKDENHKHANGEPAPFDWTQREWLEFHCVLLEGDEIQDDLTCKEEFNLGSPEATILDTKGASYRKVERRFVPSNDNQPSHVITVRLPSSHAPPERREVTLRYDSGLRGNYSRSVPTRGATSLRKIFKQCVEAYQPGDAATPFVVEIEATWNRADPTDVERIARLEALIDECRDGIVVAEEVVAKTPITEEIYADKVTKALKDVMWWYPDGFYQTIVNEDFADAKGIIYFYTDRLWSSILSPQGVAVSQVGSFDRAIGAQQCGTRGVPMKAANYEPGALLTHELGHMFFKSHAGHKLWGFAPYPAADVNARHLQDDGCVMNYDVDPTQEQFCGYCLLEFRGWRGMANESSIDTAVQLKREEIAAEGNSKVKAFRQLGLAFYLNWKRPNERDTARQLIGEALQSWEASGAGWTSGHAINILRSAISGYYELDRPADAQPWFKKLVQATSNKYDLKIRHHNNQYAQIDSIQSVDLLDGGESVKAPEGSYQYVNLPREERLVDGVEIPSLDRLGKRVRFKVTFTTPRAHQYWAQLRGLGTNSGHAGVGSLAPQDPPDKTEFSHPNGHNEAEQDGTTGEDGTAILEFQLPTDAGGDWFLLEVRDAEGTTLQSPAFVTMRAFFLVKVVAHGTAQGFVFADEERFRELVDEAFLPQGVCIIPVGREELTDYGPENCVLDPDPHGRNFQSHVIRQTRPKQCEYAHVVTYQPLEPYIIYACFVDQVIVAPGFSKWDASINVDLANDEYTTERVKPYWFEGRRAVENPSHLWTAYPNPHGGLFPRNLHELALAAPPEDPNRFRDERTEYAQPGGGLNNADKRWFIRIEAKITESGEQTDVNETWHKISINDASGVQDNEVEFPGRCDRIKVDLRNFKGAHPRATKADLRVQALLASARGGLVINGGHKAVIVVSTRKSYQTVGKTIEEQASGTVHEIGHVLGMVEPGTDLHYNKGGDHCKAGLGDVDPTAPGHKPDDIVDIPPQGQKKMRAHAECVMYEAIRPAPAPPDNKEIHRFCDTCRGWLRAHDCSGGTPAGAL